MGREIRRVAKDWVHPKDEGDRSIPLLPFNYMEKDSDPEDYMPEIEPEHTAFQIYENVSEGTPVSPVFETEDEMKAWLIEKGYTEKAVEKFVELGFAVSMTFTSSTGLIPGIQSYDEEAVEKGEMDKDFKI